MLAIAVAVVDVGASITATTCIFTPTVNPGSDFVLVCSFGNPGRLRPVKFTSGTDVNII
jgi:hypothetical protein